MDLKRGNAAKDSILAEISTPDNKASFAQNVQVLPLDLSSFASIRKFVILLKEEAKISKIDILVNNAGIMALPERSLTEDGIEAQIGTNHFGHFLLTMLVWPILANDARIVNHTGSLLFLHHSQFPFYDPLVRNSIKCQGLLYFVRCPVLIVVVSLLPMTVPRELRCMGSLR